MPTINEPCDKAPTGWKCSRRKNHAGPCAAYPAELPIPDKHPHRPYDAGYADGWNACREALLTQRDQLGEVDQWPPSCRPIEEIIAEHEKDPSKKPYLDAARDRLAKCDRCGMREGWQWVPVEPTREMFIAASKVDDQAYIGGSMHGADDATIWYAMLSAAPRPDDEGKGNG